MLACITLECSYSRDCFVGSSSPSAFSRMCTSGNWNCCRWLMEQSILHLTKTTGDYHFTYVITILHNLLNYITYIFIMVVIPLLNVKYMLYPSSILLTLIKKFA